MSIPVSGMHCFLCVYCLIGCCSVPLDERRMLGVGGQIVCLKSVVLLAIGWTSNVRNQMQRSFAVWSTVLAKSTRSPRFLRTRCNTFLQFDPLSSRKINPLLSPLKPKGYITLTLSFSIFTTNMLPYYNKKSPVYIKKMLIIQQNVPASVKIIMLQ
jgi:hypothetical protein